MSREPLALVVAVKVMSTSDEAWGAAEGAEAGEAAAEEEEAEAVA